MLGLPVATREQLRIMPWVGLWSGPVVALFLLLAIPERVALWLALGSSVAGLALGLHCKYRARYAVSQALVAPCIVMALLAVLGAGAAMGVCAVLGRQDLAGRAGSMAAMLAWLLLLAGLLPRLRDWRRSAAPFAWPAGSAVRTQDSVLLHPWFNGASRGAGQGEPAHLGDIQRNMTFAPLFRFFRRLFLIAALFALAWWGWPRLPETVRAPWYMLRLSLQEAPTHLAMPVQGVSPRQVVDTFGAPRGTDRRHEGIDIFAPRGTPVLSATEGVVVRVGENNLGGLVVWVLGPGRQRHYYAHLDGYADIVGGQRVSAGDVLGYVGNTGNARGTPPHLHYGVYHNGAVNPYPLLTAPPPAPEPAVRETASP